MPQDDLFMAAADSASAHRPLAERMRPQTLEAMVGHEDLLGSNGMLQRLIRAHKAVSIVFFGPPGSGKTTLAHALAKGHNVQLTVLSAVSAGIKDIRQVAETARERRAYQGLPTWLFIDEIHRFNRGQQDALLPHVESGLLTLLGATTENPAFEVNGALLSRCRVVRLQALSTEALATLLARALKDAVLGLGTLQLRATHEVLVAIARHSHGDARRALGTLEAASALTVGAGRQDITVDDARLAAQDRFLVHDMGGEAHHVLLSALIKSMRASDADAAVYYLARLLEAGEAPRTPLRRMVIFASEDIGTADPAALPMSIAALQAFELVGLPEGTLPMTQLAIYLARAPKSRAVVDAYGRAQDAVKRFGPCEVPRHLHPHAHHSVSLGHGRAREEAVAPGLLGAGVAARKNLPLALQGQRLVQDDS